MKSMLTKLIRKFGNVANDKILYEMMQSTATAQEVQVLLREQYKNLASCSTKRLPSFSEVGFRRYSQFEEDGILLFIFSIIGQTNRIAVEICAGSGMQCNSANLIINHGWQGFLFDGDEKNVYKGKNFYSTLRDTSLCPPVYNQAWITAENINDVIEKSGISGDIDFLSLDIDGMDYWVWKALECISPRVVVCETQNIIPPDKALTVPYNPEFVITIPDYHSASLAAMTKLAEQKGYRLVGTNRYGFNAFFIRKGICDDLFPAVTVFSCDQNPYTKNAREKRWPKVKDMKWVEV